MQPKGNVPKYFFILLNILLLAISLPLPANATDGFVEGHVKNKDGNPVTGLYVDACVAPCSSWIPGPETDENGYYKITLPVGTYKIRYYTFGDYAQYAENWYNNQPDYANAEDVAVQAGATNTLSDTTLISGGSISGTVTNGSVGVAGVYIYVYSNGTWTGRSATTNSLGKYKVSGLGAGDYTVKFSGVNAGLISEWYDKQASQNDATTVHVESPTETPNINAALAFGGKISGQVTVKETGLPITGAWVAVCESSTTTVCNSNNPARKGYAQTGIDGSYIVAGLPTTMDYKVQFFEKTTNNAGAGVNKWYDGASDVSSAATVSVGTDNVNMAFNGASISGTVTKAGGSGIAGVTVKAYDSSGNLVATSAPTESGGTYTIVGLQRGNYRLYFQAFGTDYVSEWYNDAATMSAASSVAITSLDNTLTKDAELALGGSISGTVELLRNPNSESVPVEGGLVQVYDSTDSSVLEGVATTASGGTYEVTGLPLSGNFKVRFFSSATSDDSGYGTSEWYDNQPDFNKATEVKAGDTVDAVLEPITLTPIYKLLLLKKR